MLDIDKYTVCYWLAQHLQTGFNTANRIMATEY